MKNNNPILDDMEEIFRLNESGASSTCNDTELPIDMRFNEGHLIKIITYSILMLISATGNIAVLIMTMIRKRKSKSRINTLVMHLAMADLFVSTDHRRLST